MEQLFFLKRGSENKTSQEKGCIRKVMGKLIGSLSNQVRVELLEDDPMSTIDEWSKKGDKGWWSRSQITEYKGELK